MNKELDRINRKLLLEKQPIDKCPEKILKVKNKLVILYMLFKPLRKMRHPLHAHFVTQGLKCLIA